MSDVQELLNKESIEKKKFNKRKIENRNMFPHVGLNLSNLIAKKYILFISSSYYFKKSEHTLRNYIKNFSFTYKNNEKVMYFGQIAMVAQSLFLKL